MKKTPEEILRDMCAETGTMTYEEWQAWNGDDVDINADATLAAQGDVAAVLRLRHAFGLAPIV